MPPEPNAYYHRWFEIFHVGIAQARTKQETDFVCALALLPSFRHILDVGCGMGRHARALFDRGYSAANDRDAVMIAKAREAR